MKTNKNLAILALMLIVFGVPSYADSIALRFLGTGEIIDLETALEIANVDLDNDTNLTDAEISDLETELDDLGGCWPVPMVEPASEIPLGTGIDCLVPFDVSADSNGEGISLRALSFFVFNNGTIVTLGLTSVRPFRDGGIGDAGGDMTHITGSIPSDDSGVIGGTGAYAGKIGKARVSGAVFLGDFPGVLTFDCLWLVGQDMPAEPQGK